MAGCPQLVVSRGMGRKHSIEEVGTGAQEATTPMTVRALPTASYPVLVCEAAIPVDATRAQLVMLATGTSWELPLHSQCERVYVVCLPIVAGCVKEPA
jgi:hypothetical protein